MIYYEKVLLYVYPHLDAIVESLDNCVINKALHSANDFSSAYKQAENILNLTEQKGLLLDLKEILDKVIATFNEEDMKYFEYKYFKNRRKSYFENFDFSSRQYFRKQVKLAKQFREKLENEGLTEEEYDKSYSQIDFLSQVALRVIELEKISYKNKKKDPNVMMIKRCQKVKNKKLAI